MYAQLAKRITNAFVSKGSIKDADSDVYAYGFQILLSSISYALIFILISIVTNTLLESLIFFVGFYIVRSFCGGYHASTYLRCHILFAANHLAFIALIRFFPSSILGFAITALYAFCIISILLLAPVDHKSKRFIKNEYKTFRKKSVIYSILLILLLCFVAFGTLPSNHLLLSHCIGTLSATVSLIVAKIINYKERKKENEEASC